ncbi:hypothetical protein L2E82_52826 [Cichorium intybus]|nr:hypothetical protein L2E82_52826 [Cichorium intybus]
MRGAVLAFPDQDRSHTYSVRDRPPQLCIDRKAGRHSPQPREWLRPIPKKCFNILAFNSHVPESYPNPYSTSEEEGKLLTILESPCLAAGSESGARDEDECAARRPATYELSYFSLLTGLLLSFYPLSFALTGLPTALQLPCSIDLERG